MSKVRLKIKPILFAALSVLIIYICIPGNVFKTAYADDAGNGSTIAGVSVSGLDKAEIEKVLQEAIAQWVTEPVTVSGGGQEVQLDASQFTFDVEGTIAQYETTVDKPWYAIWESDHIVHLPLQVTIPEEAASRVTEMAAWDAEATLANTTTQVSYLKEHIVEAVLSDISQIDNERIALTIEDLPSDAEGVQEIAGLLNETVLNPSESFSYIGKIGEMSANRTAKNFVASLLYDAVLQTEFELLERHAQEQIPAYLEPGINAAINLQYNEDLQFLNSSNNAAKIMATVEGVALKIEIYSNEKVKEVLVQVKEEEISPRIINRFSEDLAIGQQELVQEGEKGLRVVVTRVISESGSTTEELISRDYYAPVNRIVLLSAKQPEQTVTPDNSGITGNNGAATSTDNTNAAGPNDSTTTTNPNSDPDTQIDLDNNDLPDMPSSNEEEDLPEGSYYDKGGNLITP